MTKNAFQSIDVSNLTSYGGGIHVCRVEDTETRGCVILVTFLRLRWTRELGNYALLIRCSKFLEGRCRNRIVLDRNFDRLTRTVVRNLQLTKVHLWGKKAKISNVLGKDGENWRMLQWDYAWMTLLPLRCSELSVRRLCVWWELPQSICSRKVSRCELGTNRVVWADLVAEAIPFSGADMWLIGQQISRVAFRQQEKIEIFPKGQMQWKFFGCECRSCRWSRVVGMCVG